MLTTPIVKGTCSHITTLTIHLDFSWWENTQPNWRDPRETGWEDVDWMHLAQNRDQWRALVNTVMNLRVS